MKLKENEIKFLKIAGLGILAIGIIFFWKRISNFILRFSYGTKEDKNKPSSEISEGEAKALVSRVITDTYWTKSDSSVYSDILKLNDNSLIRLHNVFTEYFSENHDNLSLSEFINENKIFHSQAITDLIQRLRILTDYTG